MGDAEREFEYKLVFFGFPVDSDILKVGHHGSRTSSAEEFVRAVSPDISVVEVGKKNRYGHPHRAVLERFAAVRAPVFRTDRDGAITISLDGRSARVQTFTGRRAALDLGAGAMLVSRPLDLTVG